MTENNITQLIPCGKDCQNRPLFKYGDKQLFFWKGFYWWEIKKIKHDCGKELIIYQKYRKFKGDLWELKVFARICPNCQTNY